MKTTILFYFLIIPFALIAQTKPRIIYPKSPFLNQTTDTLYCLPKQKLESLMDWEEISTALIQSLKARNAESDSLLSLKTRVAQGWYGRLIESDKLFEESELLKVQEQQKARKRSKLWFGAGTLMGFLIGGIL